jgi:cell division septum initiation protein DivIVA
MFKKVLQSISKSLQRQTEPKAAPKAAAAPAKQEAAPAKQASAPAAESTLKKIAAPPAPPPEPPKSPDELCGIEPKMNKDQIRERLKLLYRRYNRAASSLEAKTRAEADKMLDAIVKVREKNFGEI